MSRARTSQKVMLHFTTVWGLDERQQRPGFHLRVCCGDDVFSEVVGRLKGSQAPSAVGDVAPKSTSPSGKKWVDCIDTTVSSCPSE